MDPGARGCGTHASNRRDVADHSVDDVVGIDAGGAGLVTEYQAMAQDIVRNGAHIVRRGEFAAG